MNRVFTAMATSASVLGGAMLIMISAGVERSWSLDQPKAPFDRASLFKSCQKDKNGDIRPDSEIQRCCAEKGLACRRGCSDRWKSSADRTACNRRCDSAVSYCYTHTGGEKSTISPTVPGLKRQQQPNVVAPTQQQDFLKMQRPDQRLKK